MWTEESYDIAITKYDGVTIDAALPQSYIDENLLVCQERITLGGYRLATLIEYIYPSRSQEFLQ